MKSAAEIRTAFLKFFEGKEHQIVASSPIVVKNDPTLMFTNAGMNPFKDIFLGLKAPGAPRVADTQKCLRVSGKHNDLEEVGHDTYHHTMFEMLGNWSFGDYYKKEAISWAWELLVDLYGINPDRLYATVFGGDEQDSIAADTEAEDYWKAYLPDNQVLRFGKKDNFWEMGEVGPSGPCSEIHIDLRPDEERKKLDGAGLVNLDHPLVIEIWNLVFIQFDRKSTGKLEDLPQKHVDTGMGFERLVMVLQGKKSTYDIDLFDGLRDSVERKSGISYAGATPEQQVAIRVVVDHIRAIVFTIADGQLPSNTGAGYVIRRILRRASRYAYRYLGLGQPFMHEMVSILAGEYRGVFDEVDAQESFIARIILEEEKGFLRKLESGTQMFEEYLRTHKDSDKVDGDFAFKLYDTFGFPIDLTQLMAQERNRSVDMDAFETQLLEQRKRSRNATQMNIGDWVVVNDEEDLPVFRGYDTLELQTRIQRYRIVETKGKKQVQLVLSETPFYSESGGQIGDRGFISKGNETLRVLDTQRENELIYHLVDKVPEDASGEWTAEVYSLHRHTVKANHSATHLLHAALRDVLGTHVEQRGSLVSEKHLRFDFSHFSAVTDEELETIEKQVNEAIARNIPLTEYRDMPIEEAKKMGAMALFGEKYGDEVRVVVFDHDYSVELCGGTHVESTGEIRLFKIVHEGSVAAGIRRIEALTADGALDWYRDRADTLGRIGALLKSKKAEDSAVEELLYKNKELEKELAQLRAGQLGNLKKELLTKAEEVNGINLIRQRVTVGSVDDLKQLSFDLKKSSENTLAVLAAIIKGKPMLSVILSDDLAESSDLHAGNMVRELAKEIKGGGGGQPFYATAGGRDPEGLDRALQKVSDLI